MKTSAAANSNQIGNFRRLVGYCTSYGTTYKPSRPELAISALETLYTDAVAANTNAINTAQILKDAINTRRIAFNELPNFCNRLFKILSISGINEKELDDARNILRKIKGRRVKITIATNEPDTEADNTVKVRHNLIDTRIENTERLVAFIAATPEYAPNEAEYQIDSLRSYLADIRAKNNAVETATIADKAARNLRDNLLFHSENSIYSVAARVKKYVNVIYGSDSLQYRQIKGIRFTTRTKG